MIECIIIIEYKIVIECESNHHRSIEYEIIIKGKSVSNDNQYVRSPNQMIIKSDVRSSVGGLTSIAITSKSKIPK